MKVLSRWSGVTIRCLPCAATFVIAPEDMVAGQHVFTRSESMLHVLNTKDIGGLMWVDCPNCRTTITVANDDIPKFYRQFVVVKKAVAT
jgi:ribosomal protein S27E